MAVAVSAAAATAAVPAARFQVRRVCPARLGCSVTGDVMGGVMGGSGSSRAARMPDGKVVASMLT
ncbi:hypothetical protein SAM23877_4194 [Streptomyces ambofaciens ATCC 23877]|uniref:Uncharacterized protein n=1 Tax=Streptomyces ambofaciens (strain ATCC 23877 / 3486 / DSM 40053 / JCM 4204 / NBRC 12836 / NRRL B-2516) TaxID=278992 RepID=A0A0K2AW43_STRA7|nr:hypothetical protein SAM23877_4194 [Streptomyces ambofaciens ATCC 23877]